MRARTQLRDVVDEDVDFFIEECNQTGDGEYLASWERVHPGQIRVHFALNADGPVTGRAALVRALGARLRWHEVFEPDIKRVQIIARRQPGFKQHDGRPRFGEYHAFEFDARVYGLRG